MRVTNSMQVNNLLNYINANKTRMDKFQNQLSTGKLINVPSDDPIIASRALRLRSDVSEIDQFLRNNSDAMSWVDTTEDALEKMTDVVHRTRELLVQGASGVLTESETKNMASELKQLKNQMIQLGNTSYAGRYIFSGYSTGRKLFNDDESSDDFGKFNVSVNTSTDKVIYEIGVGNSIDINVPGGDLFNLGGDAIAKAPARLRGGEIFFPVTVDEENSSFELEFFDGEDEDNTVQVNINIEEGTYQNIEELTSEIQQKLDDDEVVDIDVSSLGNRLQFEGTDALEGSTIKIEDGSSSLGLADENLVSTPGTQAQNGSFVELMDDIIELFENNEIQEIGKRISNMEAQLDNINRIRSDLGARHNRLELTENRLETDKVTFTRLMSENEDADMAEVIMRLKNEENVYKASLSGGARIIQPNLLDFLR